VAWFILLCCVPIAFGIFMFLRGAWNLLVRPLTERIPTGSQYRARMTHTQERRR
jgi:hypothetical protein